MKHILSIGVLLFAVAVFLTGPCVFAGQATMEDIYKVSRVDIPVDGKLLIITDNDFNDTELLYPYYRFVEEGYQVTIATLSGGTVTGYNSASVTGSVPVAGIRAEDYAGLYLPGGKAPASLSQNAAVLEIVNDFIASGKPVAAICHGPQILAAAGMLEGLRVTAWPGIENEMVEAGATFIDQPVVIDRNIVTARMPGDLPAQMHVFLQKLDEWSEGPDAA
ncbi:MAG: putative cysteine protease YraA [Candidatus Omnitrophica bacterium ADurb.Bin277]|nr:MAG: putative cysteine protease YraA [Candidatus Omnitrophica bacterium ADurb.Bin277]